MTPITTFQIEECYGIERSSEPVVVSVPLPLGLLYETEAVSVRIDTDDSDRPCGLQPLAFWPDASIRWACIHFNMDCPPNSLVQGQLLKVESTDRLSKSVEGIKVTKNELGCLESLAWGGTKLELTTRSNGVLPISIFRNGKQPSMDFGISFKDENDVAYRWYQIGGAILELELASHVRFVISGELAPVGLDVDPTYDFENIKLDFLVDISDGSPLLEITAKVHNPNPSVHSGGFWELGDQGSFKFKELAFTVATEKEDLIGYRESSQHDWRSIADSERVSIYQESSGKANWQSSNHINCQGKVPLSFSGFKVLKGDKCVAEGGQASPSVAYSCVGLVSSKFWQNFPKCLSIESGLIRYELFPSMFPDSFELQGGESKTHRFAVVFGDSLVEHINATQAYLEQPLVSSIPMEAYRKSMVLPYDVPVSHSAFHSELQQFIDYGLDGEGSYVSKREQIDEYGWRNFGEVYADHEGLYHKSERPLISHYNNQYDMVYGFWNQYFVSSRKDWRRLANELAEHVVDIDIYHTFHDRPEYNHGLFWHTDHYLDAHSSTHRTFNRLHLKEDHVEQSGGGPGSEHCYSLGLAYTYFQTGQDRYKREVIGLNRWIASILGEPNTVLGVVLTFLKRDAKKLSGAIKGQKIERFVYPLTRATGNFVNSHLDCWMVSSELKYLDDAFDVISHTVHPHENIGRRNLENIEKGWSYLIFLQSVCRFIHIKESLKQIDEQYQYALASLMLYAEWMSENEYYFLDKPEVLAYPNYTWTAQDVRKVYLLNFASSYVDGEKANKMLGKAKIISDKILADAVQTQESRYSRFMAVLMQSPIFDPTPGSKTNYFDLTKMNFVSFHSSVTGVLFGFAKTFFSRLVKIRLGDEISWIKSRVKSNG